MVYGTDTGVNSPNVGKTVRDAGVPRFRKRYIISEQTQMGSPVAYDRAVWECNRRIGRSQAVNVVCDSWRDASAQLWAPNHLAPIRLPALKLPDKSWLIASVTYVRDIQGQHAQVVLMPKEAFSPEPVVVQPLPPLVQDVERYNATRKDTP
jgi:prophage tail gpP-like protein